MRIANLVVLLMVMWFVVGCGGGSTPSPSTTSAAVASSSGRFGVLLMAHGGPPEWNQAVLDSVKPLQSKFDVEVAFGMADAASLQESVQKLEARNVRRIGVVRLFVSGESFFQETEQIFGLRAGAPAANGQHPIHTGHAGHSMAFFRLKTNASLALSAEGLADAPEMGNILADRAAALSKAPAREDVLILAHGPGDDAENARWMAKLDARAAVVRTRAPFRRVQVETLREDWPDKRAAAEKRIRAFVERASAEGGKAIVLPFRVQGFGPYKSVLEGLDYAADGAGLIPHAEVTKWIARQAGALEQGAFRAPSAS
ncbi:hypothetical protein LVJ94_02595 [Pendulispora rubella]|uniref:Uncharacterized protein n=1 Tax=Pendulispora rubella TaxID=2741070 RepID=A0ABZ2L8L1_9BACT